MNSGIGGGMEKARYLRITISRTTILADWSYNNPDDAPPLPAIGDIIELDDERYLVRARVWDLKSYAPYTAWVNIVVTKE